MNNPQTRRRQRGVSTWTMIGSLLIVAGMAGLGIAVIKPGGRTSATASITTAGGAAALPAAVTKPAAPGEASSQVGRSGASSGPGPNPNWHGTWRGATPGAGLVITAAMVGACKWVNATEPRFDAACEAGYAKSSVSLADISRRFEESVALFQRDPSDFSISDPIQSRLLISRIKPGNYRVIWMQDGSDCGMGDLITDGDLILRVVDCRYRHQISLFTRER